MVLHTPQSQLESRPPRWHLISARVNNSPLGESNRDSLTIRECMQVATTMELLSCPLLPLLLSTHVMQRPSGFPRLSHGQTLPRPEICALQCVTLFVLELAATIILSVPLFIYWALSVIFWLGNFRPSSCHSLFPLFTSFRRTRDMLAALPQPRSVHLSYRPQPL